MMTSLSKPQEKNIIIATIVLKVYSLLKPSKIMEHSNNTAWDPYPNSKTIQKIWFM